MEEKISEFTMLNIDIHGALRTFNNIKVERYEDTFRFKDSPLILEEYDSTTSSVDVNDNFMITGTLVDVVGSACSDLHITALVDGQNIDSYTDKDGEFELWISSPTAPKEASFIVGEVKTTGFQLSYDAQNVANLGKITVNSLLGDYYFQDTIKYSDDKPYKGMVS